VCHAFICACASVDNAVGLLSVYVSDFGLSRVKSESYGHTLSNMGPVKYMA
jgi:hypothetical protein